MVDGPQNIEEDIYIKQLEHEELILDHNSTGQKTIQSLDSGMMLTLKHTIGKGAFCKVVLAEGVYDSGDVVPYALKVYSKSNLNHEVSSSDPSCLKIIKEIDRL